MEEPRQPHHEEFKSVLNFLNSKLRENANWSIATEYPTALTPNNIHNMRIITDENEAVLAHAVLKPLIIKSPHVVFKVGAIGSVVTSPEHRNKGYSTKIINECNRLATEQQCDITILWTDKFDFYRKFGYELAGTEYSFVIEENFSMPNSNLKFKKDIKVSAEAIFRIYQTHTVNSVRSVEEINKFIQIPQTNLYTAWDINGQLMAYAAEGKGADLSGYIHEWGGSVQNLMSLFSYIRKEKNTPITVITPKHAENLITHLREISAIENQGFLGMIKVVNFEQLSAKIKRAFRAEGIADILLEKQNNNYVFGIGKDYCTLENDSDFARLLFGPIDYTALEVFDVETVKKLQKILPLKLWIWGWDSI